MNDTFSEREDAYRDLGYLPKEDFQKGHAQVQKALSRMNEMRIDRRQANFDLVKELEPSLVDEGQGTVSLTILGRQIDFHLPSNTFYLHAKQQFGYGIEQQVRLIQAFLKGKK